MKGAEGIKIAGNAINKSMLRKKTYEQEKICLSEIYSTETK